MASFDTRESGSWDQDVAALAGSLVHEVKNPLSTLNINAQLLIEEWPDPASPREKRMVKRLGVMVSEIARIEEIANSFLRFTEQQILETRKGDLNVLLENLLSHNAEGHDRQGIRVHFNPDPELPAIDLDESLVRQALLNLLRNAEQAMPDGGELIVTTRSTDTEVEVEIIDTGEGIPEERLPRVFQPYYSSKKAGTGLGLPTTLRIVRGHGGNIRVETEEGKGCRFIVSLPKQAKPSAS